MQWVFNFLLLLSCCRQYHVFAMQIVTTNKLKERTKILPLDLTIASGKLFHHYMDQYHVNIVLISGNFSSGDYTFIMLLFSILSKYFQSYFSRYKFKNIEIMLRTEFHRNNLLPLNQFIFIPIF